MNFHPGQFSWYDHVSGDPAKARTFYEALFGWSVKRVPGSQPAYDMIHDGDEGIAGLIQAPAGVPSHWSSCLSVTDVDVAFNAALAAGAKALMPPRDFAAGRGATIADPAGAPVTLWRGAQGDRPDRAQVCAGDWIWNELATPDPAQAVQFYERVFGYTHDSMDMGPQGTYYMLKSPDGQARAGVMKAEPGMPAMWVPYVSVEDADKTAARIAPLGGKLLVAPQDIPGIGRFAMFTDPLGAAIALIKPEVMA